MNIRLQNSASIHLGTDLPKFGLVTYLPTVLPGSGEQVCFLSSRFLALLLLALAGRSKVVQRDLCSVFGIFGFIRSIA